MTLNPSPIFAFHGPEVFDLGHAETLLLTFKPEVAYVAGIMARTAAEESKLPLIFDCRRPSQILSECPPDRSMLVCVSKNEASSHRFGSIINERLKTNSGLIQVECETRIITLWNKDPDEYIKEFAKIGKFEIRTVIPPQPCHGNTRIIGGCLPGEPVFINGIIIGYATSEEVKIRKNNNTIESISGITLKPHGIEKVLRGGMPDLCTAWCKTGMVRRAAPSIEDRTTRSGRILVIDHCAINLYDRITPDICGILAIGDDTTAICAHIGAHRGIPVLGITDDDRDGIVMDGAAEGTVILRAVNERDDELGLEIAKMIPDEVIVFDDFVKEVVKAMKGRVIVS